MTRLYNLYSYPFNSSPSFSTIVRIQRKRPNIPSNVWRIANYEPNNQAVKKFLKCPAIFPFFGTTLGIACWRAHIFQFTTEVDVGNNCKRQWNGYANMEDSKVTRHKVRHILRLRSPIVTKGSSHQRYCVKQETHAPDCSTNWFGWFC